MRPSEIEFSQGKKWLSEGAAIQTYQGWLRRLELISFDDLKLLMAYYRVGVDEIGTIGFFMKYIKRGT